MMHVVVHITRYSSTNCLHSVHSQHTTDGGEDDDTYCLKLLGKIAAEAVTL